MPRTKVNRGLANKRARENASEIDDILRDLDIEYEVSIQNLRREHQLQLDEIDNGFENLRKKLSSNILTLTMEELRKYQIYDDIESTLRSNLNEMNRTLKETLKEKCDEGYITGSSNKSQLTDGDNDIEVPSTAIKAKISTISSLKSFKSRRRSQSSSNIPTHTTPGPRAMMKLKTPNVKNTLEIPSSSTHMSRSKFRTPISSSMQKTQQVQRAVSADRVNSIVPKVNPQAPVAILRHAKPGEVAFSVSGSPVAPTHAPALSVNVNIPYENGVMLIRPDQIDPSQLDTTLINNVVKNSIDDMRSLKNALDILMLNYERRERLMKH